MLMMPCGLPMQEVVKAMPEDICLRMTLLRQLFHFHITRIVFDKQRPFFRIVIRHVPHPTAIGNHTIPVQFPA